LTPTSRDTGDGGAPGVGGELRLNEAVRGHFGEQFLPLPGRNEEFFTEAVYFPAVEGE
jgi:hypothetical protein